MPLPIVSLSLLVIISSIVLVHAQICSPGKYATQGTCQNCPPGKFIDTTGATACLTCPNGTIPTSPSTLGSTNCTLCGVGTYAFFSAISSTSSCEPCPSGTYSKGNVTSCSSCPIGEVTNQALIVPFNPNCLSCNTGYNAGVNCSKCPPGKFYFSSSNPSCDSCPQNSYSDSEASLQCTACPAGWISLQGSSSYDQCVECPAGSVATQQSFGNPFCTICSSTAAALKVYSYSPGNLSSPCQICPLGYSTITISSLTVPVFSSSSPGQLSFVETRQGDIGIGCKICPSGTYTPYPGVDCMNCEPGTTSNGGNSNCTITCPAGRFSQLGSACIPCLRGFYSEKAGSGFCMACPAGKFNSASGLTSCSNCPTDQVCLPGSDIPWRSDLTPFEVSPENGNAFAVETAAKKAALNLAISSLLISGGAVFLVIMILAAAFFKLEFCRQNVQRCTEQCCFDLTAIDLLFSGHHYRPDGAAVVIKSTSLGGVISVLCMVALLVLGLFLGLSSFMTPNSSDVIEPQFPAVTPGGTFRLTVEVFGNGWGSCELSNPFLSSMSQSNSFFNPTSPGPSFFGGLIQSTFESWSIGSGGSIQSQNIATSNSSCKMTWSCTKCQLLSSTAVLSLVSAPRACQLANWLTVKFETPDYILKSRQFSTDETTFSIKGNVLPGPTLTGSVFYTNGYGGNSGSFIKPTVVNINLTPFVVKQGVDDIRPRVTFIPSLGTSAPSGNVANMSQLYCPPSPTATGSFGTHIDFNFNVASYSLVKVVEQASVYSIIVLLAAQAASVIAIFAFFHRKIGQVLKLYPGAEETFEHEAQSTPDSDGSSMMSSIANKIRKSLVESDLKASQRHQASTKTQSTSPTSQPESNKRDASENVNEDSQFKMPPVPVTKSKPVQTSAEIVSQIELLVVPSHAGVVAGQLHMTNVTSESSGKVVTSADKVIQSSSADVLFQTKSRAVSSLDAASEGHNLNSSSHKLSESNPLFNRGKSSSTNLVDSTSIAVKKQATSSKNLKSSQSLTHDLSLKHELVGSSTPVLTDSCSDTNMSSTSESQLLAASASTSLSSKLEIKSAPSSSLRVAPTDASSLPPPPPPLSELVSQTSSTSLGAPTAMEQNKTKSIPPPPVNPRPNNRIFVQRAPSSSQKPAAPKSSAV